METLTTVVVIVLACGLAGTLVSLVGAVTPESKPPQGDDDTPINRWAHTRYSGFGKRTLVGFIVTLIVGLVAAAVLQVTGNWKS